MKNMENEMNDVNHNIFDNDEIMVYGDDDGVLYTF